MISLISQIILRIHRKMFLFFFSCLCLSYVGGEKDLCVESCTTERSLELTSETEIDFKGKHWTQYLNYPTYQSQPVMETWYTWSFSLVKRWLLSTPVKYLSLHSRQRAGSGCETMLLLLGENFFTRRDSRALMTLRFSRLVTI